MSHRSSLRRSVSPQQPTRTRTRSTESNRVKWQRPTCYKTTTERIQLIPEGRCANNDLRGIEIQEQVRQEPRYDSQELRRPVCHEQPTRTRARSLESNRVGWQRPTCCKTSTERIQLIPERRCANNNLRGIEIQEQVRQEPRYDSQESRRPLCHEQPTRTRARSLESNRVGRQPCCKPINERIQVIPEECCAAKEPPKIEIQEPRYDPQELREAIRILSPFVRLMEDSNNPYSRIVAREICKTFYCVFHPDMRYDDVLKTINRKSKTQRTKQIWNEICHYFPERKINKWVSLRESVDFIDLNDYCGLNQAQIVNEDCGPTDCSPLNSCATRARNNRRKPLACSTPVKGAGRCVSNACFDNMSSLGRHQSAGHDSTPTPYTRESKSKLLNHIPSAAVQTTAGTDDTNNNHTAEFDTKRICEKISNSKRQLEELVKAAGRNRSGLSAPNAGETDEISSSSLSSVQNFLDRQYAGNDIILPYCEPGCSTDPPGYRDRLSQNEYYRKTANTPRREQNRSQIRPEMPRDKSGEECVEDSGSATSAINTLNEAQIACNASLVANAFKNLSLASNELLMKKDAFRKLTESYLKFAANPLEVSPPACSKSPNTQRMMQKIYKMVPKLKNKLIADEWNENCFKDKDFIRLLPFYESVHNQLEYISREQRDYGVNMLDDIMSSFYHIHYDLGDPRLKNLMVVEHVKLITRNTWELYFYKENKKLPAIPEPPRLMQSPEEIQPQLCFPPSSEEMPPQLCRPQNLEEMPPQLCRKPSPEEMPPQLCRPPSPAAMPPQVCRPPSPEEMPPQCLRPSTSKRPVSSPKPNTNSPIVPKKRHGASRCCSRQEVPQQAQNSSPRDNFLRRSQPSGMPKSWSPTLRSIERPPGHKEFKAKPLPKFVRDRLGDRGGPC